MDTPNFEKIYRFLSDFENEYDLGRLARYKTLTPELIELAEKAGLTQEVDASRALFISDFIVTSSEVPAEVDDEERRISIIKFFIDGFQRNQDSDKLMRAFYLSHKVAQAIKRNDYFLAGRGLDRASSQIIFKDILIAPYLEVAKHLLGEGDPAWELALLASAVKSSLPHLEMSAYSGVKSSDNLLPYTWKILREFEKAHKVDKNDLMSIPNIDKSQIILLTKFSGLPHIGLTNISKKVDVQEKILVNDLLNFMEESDSDKSILYVSGSVVNSDENVLLVRNGQAEGKPVVIIKTPADEVNVTEMLSLLEQRSMEADAWNKLYNKQRVMVSYEKVTEEIEVDVENEVDVDEEIEVENVPAEGFVGKIKRLFGRKQGSKTKKVVTKKVKKKTTKKEMKKIKKNLKKEKAVLNIIPNYVSDAMGALSLGDLNLFEIFDTVRESEYIIVGTLESDFKANITTFLVDELGGDPHKLSTVLDGLDEVIERLVNYYFSSELQIRPNEVLFLTGEESRFLITFEGNEDRLVGTIATTYIKDITQWQEKEDKEILSRRTMKMRTRQLLSSRAHTPLDTSIERIYGDIFKDNSSLITLNKAILKIS